MMSCCIWPGSLRMRTGSRSSAILARVRGGRPACADLSLYGYNEAPAAGMTMKRKRSMPHLRLLFVLAVAVPCLVLGIIAIRSINRERAFVEMRLQRTIDAELVSMVSPAQCRPGPDPGGAGRLTER